MKKLLLVLRWVLLLPVSLVLAILSWIITAKCYEWMFPLDSTGSWIFFILLGFYITIALFFSTTFAMILAVQVAPNKEIGSWVLGISHGLLAVFAILTIVNHTAYLQTVSAFQYGTSVAVILAGAFQMRKERLAG